MIDLVIQARKREKERMRERGLSEEAIKAILEARENGDAVRLSNKEGER